MYKNNLQLIIAIAEKTRQVLKEQGKEEKIKVIRCGEKKPGKHCWVYIKDSDRSKPTTQIIPKPKQHFQEGTSLLKLKDEIFESIEMAITKHENNRN